MKAPQFWEEQGLIPIILKPFAKIYQWLGEWRWNLVTPMEMPIPLICIGNVVAGGAGKTPVALALGELLRAKNIPFHYISRGYGGKTQATPLCVTPRHSAAEVGDEPLLLSKMAPCWVGKDRKSAATKALRAGAQMLVMDDGYQNPALNKSLSLLVIDGAYGIGNGRVMPAGPLRETLEAALTRADAVIFVGKDQHGLRHRIPPHIPQFSGHLEPQTPLSRLSQPVLAFAGIGRPQKFFTMLQNAGVVIAETQSFPDHHQYTEKDIEALKQRATALQATLTCTTKDAVKLPTLPAETLQVVEIAFRFEDLRGFTEWLESKL